MFFFLVFFTFVFVNLLLLFLAFSLQHQQMKRNENNLKNIFQTSFYFNECMYVCLLVNKFKINDWTGCLNANYYRERNLPLYTITYF